MLFFFLMTKKDIDKSHGFMLNLIILDYFVSFVRGGGGFKYVILVIKDEF